MTTEILCSTLDCTKNVLIKREIVAIISAAMDRQEAVALTKDRSKLN